VERVEVHWNLYVGEGGGRLKRDFAGFSEVSFSRLGRGRTALSLRFGRGLGFVSLGCGCRLSEGGHCHRNFTVKGKRGDWGIRCW